ncbi:MAG: ATP-binding protein [Mycobacteriales bacterium]
MTVAHAPRSAAVVRRAVAADLGAVISQDLLDDVLLAASELIANAARHGTALPGETMLVEWSCRQASVDVRVTDGGGEQRPRLRRGDHAATGGRGLAIVDALATTWGVERADGTTTVWARLLGNNLVETHG